MTTRFRSGFTCFLAGLCAATSTLASNAKAADDLTFWETYTPELVPAIDLGSDMVAAYSGLASVLNVARTLGHLLGLPIGDETSLETRMDQQFDAIRAQLDTVQMGIEASSGLSTEQHIGNLRGAAIAASVFVRGFVIANNSPMPESLAGPAVLQSLTSTLSLADSSFQRVHFASDNDGVDTVTLGVVTRAEWKQVITPPAPTNGRMHEWRLGVPALAQITAARLTVLASVFPDFGQTTRFDGELRTLRDRINTIRNRSEGFIKCGESVWAAPGMGSFLLKKICADTATGITASVEKRATIAPPQYSSDWGMLHCECGLRGLDCKYPTGPETCDSRGRCTQPTAQVAPNACFPGKWPATATNLNGSTSPLVGLISRQKGTTSGFASILANGVDDARSLLGIKMGLFSQRKLADQLTAIIGGKRGPGYDALVQSRIAGQCMDLIPDVLDGSGVTMFPGLPFQLGTCGDPSTATSQSWWFDKEKDQFLSFGEIWLGGDKFCMDADSSRAGAVVRAAFCDGSEGQRWTYDPDSERLRNGLGKTLEMRAGTVATMQVDGSTSAQKWISD